MKCPGCDRELRRDERAQSMTVRGGRFTVRSYCDACCRANMTAPGTKAALDRLGTGKIDAAEAARVKAATPLPWEANGHRNGALANARRSDLVSPDRLPACPKCGDLCDPDATVCVECGVRLFPSEAEVAAL